MRYNHKNPGFLTMMCKHYISGQLDSIVIQVLRRSTFGSNLALGQGLLKVVAAMKGCRTAMCDKILQSFQGSITVVTQIIYSRGCQLREGDVSR